jgi:hypothetical protein
VEPLKLANNYDLSDLAVPESQGDHNFDLSDLISEPSLPQEEPSFLQKAGAIGKGAISGALGAIPDTLTLPYNLMSQLYGAVEESHPDIIQHARNLNPMVNLMGYTRQYMPQVPSVTEAVEKGISKITGETPEDVKHLAEGAKFAGSLVGPGGLAKGAAKLGKVGAEKALRAIGTTNASELAGAGLAGIAMSKLQEEGYGSPAAILGGIGAGGLTTGTIKGLGKLKEETIPYLLSIGAKPNEQMIQNAKKLGIEPPSHVQLDSKLSSFLNNSYLKSIFSSQQYQDTIKNADQKMINSVIDKINSVNPNVLEKESASKLYRESLSEEAKKIDKHANELYDNARKFLSPQDKVKPNHTLNMIKELKSKLSATVPSSDMKFVLKRLSELSSGWGLTPKGLKAIEKEYPPEVYSKYLESLKTTAPEIPLDQLIQQRSAFMRDIKYGAEARGAKGFMNSLISSLDKDIASSSNKEFINNWREANKFYKNEVSDRIRTDFAESLRKNEMPKEAYAYMSTPQHINELQRILGSSPASKQVMNALKRSKLQEVVLDRVTNADGSMSYANLANLFNKKSTQQGMLKSLLGDNNYKDLSEIAEIAATYNKVGKQYANPSGSALTKQDFDRIGNAMTFFIGAGTLGIVNPYMVSKIVSNPKYIDKAVKFAKARQHNKISEAQKYQREMKQIYLQNILPQIREAQQQEPEDQELSPQ